MSGLADEIEARAAALAHDVVVEMYANPFWLERFGERGWHFAEQDGQYHLRYLVHALRFDLPAVMVRYARWLQVLLTTRGMCTRHVAENFARLAAAIGRADITGAGRAVAYLRDAEDALVYPEGPARAIQLAAEDLAEQAVTALYRRHPDWLERWGVAGRERCRDDLLYHLSYLADAVSLGKPQVFADYARWIAGFLVRRGVPAEHLRETLAALDEALRTLPAGVAASAGPVLARGRDSLSEVAA